MPSAQPPLATATTSGMAGQPNTPGTTSPVANGSGSGGDKDTAAAKPKGNYRGFVAGVFSGIAKLSGMSRLAGTGRHYWWELANVIEI